MSEIITLKAIEQMLDKKLDDKLDEKLKPIMAGMALLATSEELTEIKQELAVIRKTQDVHTTSLDAIAKDTSNWNAEMIVMRERMKRYEDALKLVGQKLNLDLQTLLH